MSAHHLHLLLGEKLVIGRLSWRLAAGNALTGLLDQDRGSGCQSIEEDIDVEAFINSGAFTLDGSNFLESIDVLEGERKFFTFHLPLQQLKDIATSLQDHDGVITLESREWRANIIELGEACLSSETGTSS